MVCRDSVHCLLMTGPKPNPQRYTPPIYLLPLPTSAFSPRFTLSSSLLGVPCFQVWLAWKQSTSWPGGKCGYVSEGGWVREGGYVKVGMWRWVCEGGYVKVGMWRWVCEWGWAGMWRCHWVTSRDQIIASISGSQALSSPGEQHWRYHCRVRLQGHWVYGQGMNVVWGPDHTHNVFDTGDWQWEWLHCVEWRVWKAGECNNGAPISPCYCVSPSTLTPSLKSTCLFVINETIWWSWFNPMLETMWALMWRK